jgi:ferredoxin-type protein NapH
MSGRSPNPNSRNRSMRILSQILFLLVFIALIKMKRPMNWMIVFLGSTVLAALFARFYCGWICPINSVMQVSEWIGKKAKVQKDEIPFVLRSGMFAYGMLILTFVLAFLNMTGRFKLPFLLVMIGLGFLMTLRYPQAAWHKYLCPYGVILRLPAKFARLKMNVDSTCSGCGLCKKACPAEAVEIENRRATIDPGHCLVCHECSVVCPKSAIAYGGTKPEAIDSRSIAK